MNIGLMRGQVIHQRGLLLCRPDWSLRKVFEEFKEENKAYIDSSIFDSTYVVYVGNGRDNGDFIISSMDTVDPSTTISMLADFSTRYTQILYKYEWVCNLGSADVTRNHGQRMKKQKINAFKYMMESSREERYIPKLTETVKTGKGKLRNSVVTYLTTEDITFYKTEEENCTSIINTLTKVLWLLDGHHTKLETAPHVPSLPLPFQQKVPFRNIYHQGLKKKSIPNLQRDHLIEGIGDIDKLLCKKWIQYARFNAITRDMTRLKNVMIKYCDYLQNKAREVGENHRSLVPIRTLQSTQGFQLKRLKKFTTKLSGIVNTGGSSSLIEKYNAVKSVLENKPFYDPVNLREYAPEDKCARCHYYNMLRLPFNVHIFEKSTGNSEKHVFIWRIPDSDTDLSNTNSTSLCLKIDKELPTYHTRAMLKKATQTWPWLKRISNSALTALYKSFSGDASAIRITGGTIDTLMEKTNNGESITELSDFMTNSYKEREGKFNEFWQATNTILDENFIPDERRKDQILHRSSNVRSHAHLVDLVIDRLRLENKSIDNIPSEEWVRLQFEPSNKWARTSEKYTQQFHATFVLQTRLIRKYHPDHKFGSVLFNYFKQFCIKYRVHIMVRFLDDKCSIPIGDYASPVSAVRRQKRGINVGIQTATDHDHISVHIVPSVINIFEETPRHNESFYGGQVHVVLKDAIFEPSTAKRHMVELEYLSPPESNRSIEMIYTDGGGDHRTPFISVQKSYIAHFLNQDLDMLVAARTPPNLSVINPVERCMSIINLGLNGLALAREKMNDTVEDKIKSLSSKKKWRQAQKPYLEGKKSAVNYQKIVEDTTNNCNEIITKSIKSLKYKGEEFSVGKKATKESLDSFMRNMYRIDDKIDWNDDTLTKKKIMKSDSVLKFYNDHVSVTQYCFQIRKCLQPNCKYHKPVRMNINDFQKVKWLPMPTLNLQSPSEEKYKTFEEAIKLDNLPTDKDRPGMTAKPVKDSNVPVANFKCTQQKARKIICCKECKKPRLVYKDKVFSDQDHVSFENIMEEVSYSCGSWLLPPGHPLVNLIFISTNITCKSPISSQYYSKIGKNLDGYRNICFWCLEECEFAKEDPSYADKFRSFLPRCKDCKILGKTSYTRMQKNTTRKKNQL